MPIFRLNFALVACGLVRAAIAMKTWRKQANLLYGVGQIDPTQFGFLPPVCFITVA
jgi:hypothetical protein